ncbi:hypothetical protein BHE74_00030407 [Ensete ventricosum]|nr:hypothetical protein BHE74_00030407 [Ensete ventricosum]
MVVQVILVVDRETTSDRARDTPTYQPVHHCRGVSGGEAWGSQEASLRETPRLAAVAPEEASRSIRTILPEATFVPSELDKDGDFSLNQRKGTLEDAQSNHNPTGAQGLVKYYYFHRDYSHDMEEYHDLKN